MRLDRQALTELIEEAFVTLVTRRHGDSGGQALRIVMRTLHRIFADFVEPAECQGRIVVFQQVDDSSPGIAAPPADLPELADLRRFAADGFTLEITRGGALRLWGAAPDVNELSQHAVVYVYVEGEERFYAGGESKPVQNVYEGSQSVFAIPTFEEVRNALIFYRSRLIRTSSCPQFQQAWFDDDRLFFKAKPEIKWMRPSLEIFLVSHLHGGSDVRPEQNVDETHPVDIRVAWQFSHRIAIIEIKWLGKSKHSDGSRATEYTEVRAREGAGQLAGYLDLSHNQDPTQIMRGYLVVIDGRRQGLKDESVAVSVEDGFHFANAEITFNPDYRTLRTDFEEPVRMFAEPICRS